MRTRRAALGLAFCASAALALILLPGDNGTSSIAFRPDVGVIPDKSLEGRTIELNTSLVNLSRVPVRIEDYIRSCGCMVAITDDAAKLPYVLEPNGRVPVKVQIDTRNRTGYQRLRVEAKVSLPSGQVEPGPSFTVTGRIFTGLRAKPGAVFFEVPEEISEDLVSPEVRLGDDFWDVNGVDIKRIETSCDWIATRLTEANGNMIYNGMDLRVRRILRVICRPPADKATFDETVTIIPEEESAGRVIIPVKGSRRLPFAVLPDRLVFDCLRPGEKREQYLSFRYDDPRFAAVSFARLPAGTAVEELPSPNKNMRRFKLALTMPKVKGRSQSELVLKVGGSGRLITVPVSLAVGSD